MHSQGVRGGWSAVVPFFAANVLFGAGLFAHAFLYNFYLDGLGHGEAAMGNAAAALTAGGLVALVPAGLVLDRWGARATFVAATALGAVGLAWGGFAERIGPVYAAAFVAGAGAAAWRVTQGPVMMSVAEPRLRSRAFSWNVGLLLGFGALWTAVAGSVPRWTADLLGTTPMGGLRVALVLGAAVTAAGGVAFLLVPLRVAGGGSPGDATESDAPERPADPPGGLLAVPPRVRWLVFWIFVWMAGAALVLPFFNLYFLRVHELPVERIGVLFGVVQVIAAGAVFVGGEAAQRAGPARAFSVWAVVFPVALLPLALGLPLAAAVGLYAVQAFVPPATNPLLDELVMDEAEPAIRGAASSWRNAATELSGLLGASVGGLLLERGTFAGLFVAAAGVALVGGSALSLLLHRDGRRRRGG